MTDRSALGPCLARCDALLEVLPEALRARLAPGASAARIRRCEEELDVPFPPALRALYAWRDGEREAPAVFDALCREEIELAWREFHESPLEVRLMSLEEIARAGRFEADEGVLVPFVWAREEGRGPAEEPADDDWLLAVDSSEGAVWRFEVGGGRLEGTFEEAPSLPAWMSNRLVRLERLARASASRQGTAAPKSNRRAEAAPKVEPPAQLLVRLLTEKGLLELSEGVEPRAVAARIEPLLALIPRKRAVTSVVRFFEDDDAIAELFADDDTLRAIIDEFV